ncbi:phosphotransferase [Deinococcus phoenicis]|nr:phosphotransferase [Deinococcus phoenicis]
MIDTLVVIPTAKIIPTELKAEFGPLPSAMIPLNNEPALYYIFRNYDLPDVEFGIVVGEQQESIRSYLSHFSRPATIYEIDRSQNIGETVLAALTPSQKNIKHLVVNFGDTLVQRELLYQDVVVYARKRESFRWTTFDFTDSGLLGEISDKQTDKGFREENNVFVGVFEIAQPDLLIGILHRHVAGSSSENGLDPFYTALREYLARRKLLGELATFEETSCWNDFGHLDTYYDTRRVLSSGAREFNTVDVDARRGTIEKRSRHTQKLRNEIRWYLDIPEPLKNFSPRLYDYSLDDKSPSVIMEYYGYPPLNDVYLHGAYGLGEWEIILGAVELFLGEAHKFTLQTNDDGVLKSSLVDMYESKTFDRLDEVLRDSRFDYFCDQPIINGHPVLNLNQFTASFRQVAQYHRLYEVSRFTVLHGDLCLSNILFDRRNATVRVIDPRGDFGGLGVYGDPRYDLAKLSHSIHGDYDFYVNGLFDFSHSSSGFEFSPHLTERHQATKRLFERWLDVRWPEQRQQIRLIESLLFLSMVPLHADRFESQLAFLARGLELYTELAISAGAATVENEEVRLV